MLRSIKDCTRKKWGNLIVYNLPIDWIYGEHGNAKPTWTWPFRPLLSSLPFPCQFKHINDSRILAAYMLRQWNVQNLLHKPDRRLPYSYQIATISPALFAFLQVISMIVCFCDRIMLLNKSMVTKTRHMIQEHAHEIHILFNLSEKVWSFVIFCYLLLLWVVWSFIKKLLDASS